ncbi:very long chain fatty acid elongase 6-like [Antedon mediterranea]|uniref:very long chain fatty acid elongase 6-like n=1 Tax=Antedon mediterranea TaxID=105859 RepID=UPI003AF582FC
MVVEINRTSLHFSNVFEFEKGFDHRPKVNWFAENWSKAFLYSAIYVVLIFGGKFFMTNRPRYNLRMPLTIWSMTLAVFSWMGAIRLWADYIFFVKQYGFKASMCDPIFYQGVTGFWSWLFICSKLPELGDTIFIILRKQRLIFLHWYHHITVLLYAWYSYAHLVAPGRYFVLMNYTVHALMYTYYALKASKIMPVPTWVNIMITTLQLLQMIVGCIINGYAYMFRKQGEVCSTTDMNLRVSFLMYFSYFLLFAHFFYNTYMLPKRNQSIEKDHLKKQ